MAPVISISSRPEVGAASNGIPTQEATPQQQIQSQDSIELCKVLIRSTQTLSDLCLSKELNKISVNSQALAASSEFIGFNRMLALHEYRYVIGGSSLVVGGIGGGVTYVGIAAAATAVGTIAAVPALLASATFLAITTGALTIEGIAGWISNQRVTYDQKALKKIKQFRQEIRANLDINYDQLNVEVKILKQEANCASSPEIKAAWRQLEDGVAILQANLFEQSNQRQRSLVANIPVQLKNLANKYKENMRLFSQLQPWLLVEKFKAAQAQLGKDKDTIIRTLQTSTVAKNKVGLLFDFYIAEQKMFLSISESMNELLGYSNNEPLDQRIDKTRGVIREIHCDLQKLNAQLGRTQEIASKCVPQKIADITKIKVTLLEGKLSCYEQNESDLRWFAGLRQSGQYLTTSLKDITKKPEINDATPFDPSRYIEDVSAVSFTAPDDEALNDAKWFHDTAKVYLENQIALDKFIIRIKAKIQEIPSLSFAKTAVAYNKINEDKQKEQKRFLSSGNFRETITQWFNSYQENICAHADKKFNEFEFSLTQRLKTYTLLDFAVINKELQGFKEINKINAFNFELKIAKLSNYIDQVKFYVSLKQDYDQKPNLQNASGEQFFKDQFQFKAEIIDKLEENLKKLTQQHNPFLSKESESPWITAILELQNLLDREKMALTDAKNCLEEHNNQRALADFITKIEADIQELSNLSFAKLITIYEEIDKRERSEKEKYLNENNKKIIIAHWFEKYRTEIAMRLEGHKNQRILADFVVRIEADIQKLSNLSFAEIAAIYNKIDEYEKNEKENFLNYGTFKEDVSLWFKKYRENIGIHANEKFDEFEFSLTKNLKRYQPLDFDAICDDLQGLENIKEINSVNFKLKIAKLRHYVHQVKFYVSLKQDYEQKLNVQTAQNGKFFENQFELQSRIVDRLEGNLLLSLLTQHSLFAQEFKSPWATAVVEAELMLEQEKLILKNLSNSCNNNLNQPTHEAYFTEASKRLHTD